MNRICEACKYWKQNQPGENPNKGLCTENEQHVIETNAIWLCAEWQKSKYVNWDSPDTLRWSRLAETWGTER